MDTGASVIKKGILETYKNRITYVSGDSQLDDGVYLIPHKPEGLEKFGKKNYQYLRENKKWKADDYEPHWLAHSIYL